MTAPVPSGHSHAPNAVVEALTRKIGPLPAYAYVLIIVGAAFAYRAYKSRTAKPALAIVPALTTDPSSVGNTSSPSIATPVPAPLPVQSDVLPPVNGTPVYKRFVDTASGGANGNHGLVYQILNGIATPLTNSEWVGLGSPKIQNVTTADLDYGLVHNTVSVPAVPYTPTRTAQPQGHPYTVHPTDTHESIAHAVYGSPDAAPKVATASGGTLTAGSRLVLPE